MKTKDLIRKYGWEVMPYLSNLGVNLLADANLWFVDSGATNTLDADDGIHGHSFDVPLATANFAVSLCTASQGDIVLLAPGHAEDLEDEGTTSGAETDELVIDKIGVSVIGVGQGTLRPTFTLATDIGATITMSAANCRLSNVIVKSNLANITAGITIEADGCIVENCDIRDGNAANLEMVIGITVDANADDVIIKNNTFSTVPSGGCASAIFLAGGSDRCVIEGNRCYGTYSNSCLDADVAASVEHYIVGNIFANIGTVAAALHASSTGVVADNYFAGNGGTVAIALSGEDKMYCLPNQS